MPASDPRVPLREIESHPTSNMKRCVWAIDGMKRNYAKPLHIAPNDRLRLIFVENTMMMRLIHQHGMWGDL